MNEPTSAGPGSAHKDLLADLLARWQELTRQGLHPVVADLCAGCPELIPQLESLVRFGGDLEQLAQISRETLPSPSTPTCGHSVSEPLPATVGGYRVLGLLGEGGMGRVLRAEDPLLNRQVALKVMRPQLTLDEHSRQRFLREARAVAALHHDHVVPVYQVGEDQGVLFLAMPLLQGESLEARLAREPALSVSEVQRIGREAAEGLQAAHAAGLVHRDVKLANLWLEAPSGRVKILDFGLARQLTGADGVTSPGAVLGTPAFMSPEQVNGEPVDARSDLFSLGGVLYRAATGSPAFEGKTLTATLRAVAERQPPAPREVRPEVPRWLSDVILRLLAKRPEDRPASAAEVVQVLRDGGVSQQDTTEYAGRARGAAGVCAAVADDRAGGGCGDGCPDWSAVEGNQAARRTRRPREGRRGGGRRRGGPAVGRAGGARLGPGARGERPTHRHGQGGGAGARGRDATGGGDAE